MEKEYAICYSVNIPLRDRPADCAEMMTELVFGDSCEVFEKRGTWCRIKNRSDSYEGWLTSKMLTFVSREDFEAYNPLEQPVVSTYISEANEVGGHEHLLLSGGSVLPYYNPEDSTFQVNDRRFQINPMCLDTKGRTVAETAKMFINSPYLWGGKNVFGMDCSGLVQTVYRIHGVQLLRDARAQVIHGNPVSLENSSPGDIAFFSNGEGNIIHVGILLGEGKIVHASGSVHIDNIDYNGIFSEKSGQYTHHLHSIKHIDMNE